MNYQKARSYFKIVVRDGKDSYSFFSISFFQFIYIYSETSWRTPSGSQNSSRYRELSAT